MKLLIICIGILIGLEITLKPKKVLSSTALLEFELYYEEIPLHLRALR